MKKKSKETGIGEKDASVETGLSVDIDIGKCYTFAPEDFELDITTVRYSNSSFIQVTGQDVFVDFLELPGVKKEGKMVANATRIYMTHVQAEKLADTLRNILESTYQAGRMETFRGSNTK